MTRLFRRLLTLPAVAAVAVAAYAQQPDRLVFATDWLAQAEHGGFYQAIAEGIYRKHGLDVTIRMGGPQVNGLQLLAAGQLDVVMGDALQVLSAMEQRIPITAIAATFQKNPTVIIAHPGTASLADLKGKPIAVSAAANTTFWPWLKQRYGFTDDQKRPYAFSVQPFLVDPNLSQQGFVTSEPFSIERGGVRPVVFLLAAQGYPPYSEVLAVRRDTLDKRADALTRFVRASAEGWKSYLADPAPGNALIKRDNPQMSDELLAYGHRKMKEYALVTGDDGATAGLLTMTARRWQQTIEFLRAAGLTRPDVDYTRAYTLSIVRDVRVLPCAQPSARAAPARRSSRSPAPGRTTRRARARSRPSTSTCAAASSSRCSARRVAARPHCSI
jgi:NitT/TauT family transport system substrate-binding protein